MNNSSPNLNNIIAKVDEFKNDNTEILRENINNEIISYKSSLPKEYLQDDLDLEISQEINNKLLMLREEIDLKPKALYYDLKSKIELNDDISKKELTLSAYDFLEKNTKNKFLKKILKELKKEIKR